MVTPLMLEIVEDGRKVEYPLPPRLLLGRQSSNEPGPFTLVEQVDGSRRLIVAWGQERPVASQYVEIVSSRGQVHITNLSNRMRLQVSDVPGGLAPGASAVVTPPFTFSLFDPEAKEPLVRRQARVFAAHSSPTGPQSLASRSIAPGLRPLPGQQPAFPMMDSVQSGRVMDWLQVTAGVLQSAVATGDILPQAAQTLVTIVGLHHGRVLLLRDGKWHEAQAHSVSSAADLPGLSQSILERVGKGEVVWETPSPDSASVTLRSLRTVVAAPLQNRQNQVVGALYGDALRDGQPAHENQVLAVLVSMLASTVSASLARQQIDQERGLLRQFFSAELVEQLLQNPSLIQTSRQATVTILFCDVRGFSAAAEQLGERTFDWISNVLHELSECVKAHGGVIVDYVGDELMAMWGAPVDQVDHANRAIKAALAMLKECDRLDTNSLRDYQIRTRIGIGLNSGQVRVGNIGSRDRKKYGPLGDVVNVASRIQGMTKYLKCPLIVSQDTHEQLSGVASRRVVRARLAGVQRERNLYEVADLASTKQSFFPDSQAALDNLERKQFADAAQQAGKLLRDHSGDGPLQLILSRASQALLADGAGFDIIWTPPGK